LLDHSEKYKRLQEVLSTWDKKELLVGVVIAAGVISVDNLKDLIDLTALVEAYQKPVHRP
jgi:hypothetical protein